MHTTNTSPDITSPARPRAAFYAMVCVAVVAFAFALVDLRRLDLRNEQQNLSEMFDAPGITQEHRGGLLTYALCRERFFMTRRQCRDLAALGQNPEAVTAVDRYLAQHPLIPLSP